MAESKIFKSLEKNLKHIEHEIIECNFNKSDSKGTFTLIFRINSYIFSYFYYYKLLNKKFIYQTISSGVNNSNLYHDVSTNNKSLYIDHIEQDIFMETLDNEQNYLYEDQSESDSSDSSESDSSESDSEKYEIMEMFLKIVNKAQKRIGENI